MKKLLRHIRLLPAVIIVAAALLAVKGEGLVRKAWAQEQQTAAPADAAVLAKDTAPVATDPADDTDQTDSASEVDVLSSLAKRRAALDAREAEINMRADVLAAAENRVDGKIATLKQLQDKITGLLAQRDDEEKAQITALVKTYSAMKPRDAARIFSGLSDDVLIPVAQAMKSDALAPILAAMSPDAAQKLTLKLADRLKLPELAAPAVASAVAPVAPTQTPAAATPAAPVAKPPTNGSQG